MSQVLGWVTVPLHFELWFLKFRGSNTDSTQADRPGDNRNCAILFFLLAHLSVNRIRDVSNYCWT